MKKFLAVIAVLVIGMVAAGFGMNEPAPLGADVDVGVWVMIGLVAASGLGVLGMLAWVLMWRRRLEKERQEMLKRLEEKVPAAAPIRKAVDPMERLVELMTLEMVERRFENRDSQDDAPGRRGGGVG